MRLDVKFESGVPRRRGRIRENSTNEETGVDGIPVNVVVSVLIARWQTRLFGLNDYLRSTFGVDAPQPLPTSLHLSQMMDGNVKTAHIGWMFAAVWIVDGGIAREVPLNYDRRRRFETDDSGTYHIRPSYSFVHKGNKLLLSERYGPNLKHRSLGRLASHNTCVAVDWTTLWH